MNHDDVADIIIEDPLPPITPAEMAHLNRHKARIQALTGELLGMVAADPHHDTHLESVFLGPDTKERTVEIGEELCAIGGMRTMLYAHNEVLGKYGVTSARMLEMAWDGIGDWLG